MSARLEAPVRPALREQAPEPGRFWVRYAPRQWPGPQGPWVDLAGSSLAGAALQLGAQPGGRALIDRLDLPVDDVLYLPPVPPELAAARDRLARRHAGRGTPVLAQVLPGQPLPAADTAAVVVLDLTPLALDGGPADDGTRAAAPGPGAAVAAAAWPLLPGGGGALDAAVALAAAAGIALQAVPVELDPRQLRELGEGLPEERYLALFHGGLPDLAAATRAALAAGAAALMARPLPKPPLRGAGNLRLAGILAAEGELQLRLGGPEPGAQALLRAARFAERAPHDLEALAREGNLGVLPWLEGRARELLLAAIGRDPG